MTESNSQSPTRPGDPRWISRLSDPWTRAKDGGRYRTVTCDNEGKVVGLSVVGLLALAFAVFQLVTLSFTVAAVGLLVGVACIVAAGGFPTFLYTSDTPAHRLHPGHLVTTPAGTVSEVIAVFNDHGARKIEVALANGDIQAYESGGTALVATPHATRIFHQVGLDAPPFDFRPIDRHELDLLDLAWQQTIENHGPVDRDALHDRLTAAGFEPDAIDDAVRERLLMTDRAGLGTRRRTKLRFTDAGFITLKAHLREQGIEMHPDAAPSQPSPTIHVEGDGNIVTNSENSVITSQIGAGNSAEINAEQFDSDSIRHLADLLVVLKNPPVELRSVAGDEVLQPLGIALERELERDEMDPTRVGRLVRSVRELVGDVIPSVLGSAVWSILIKTWA